MEEEKIPIQIISPRGRGRPPARHQSASLSTWIPVPYHDRLITLANEKRMSVSALVRQLIVVQLEK